jgi:hypothetical protein
VKKLRDFLIVVVLGGVVIGAAVTFFDSLHSASVAQSPIVRDAEIACILDDVMICHAGYDSFASEKDANAYLESPAHLTAVKARQAQEDQAKKDAETKAQAIEFAKQGTSRVKSACIKDGTLNCDLIDKANAASFAELIIRNRQSHLLSSDQK